MKYFLLLLFFLLVAYSVSAQDPVHVPMDSERWAFSGQEGDVVLFKGQKALKLQGGNAWLEDVNFSTGTIEFDVAFSADRNFQGVRWHVQDRSNYEEFYLRSHLSGQPDANQYNPVISGVSSWQLYHGLGYSAPTNYTDDWMHVRIVVGDGIGEVFIDADTSAFSFNMKGGFESGGLGLYAGALNSTYYSNFTYMEGRPQITRAAPVYPQNEVGTVLKWSVSDPFTMTPEGIDEVTFRSLFSRAKWQTIEAEEAGITNLARATVGKEGRALMAHVQVQADGNLNSFIQFGYSDAIDVYLNGSLLYSGNNSYVSRDYRYLGTIGQFDLVPLRLKKGSNDLVFLVREGFGGWGVTAKFTELEGLKFDIGAVVLQ